MTEQTEERMLLDVSNLSIDYLLKDGTGAHAVQNVSFTLRAGEVLGVVGESGCGKSTVMLSLLRLLPAAGRIVGGSVNLLGQDLLALDEAGMARVRWKEMAMIFQGAMNALNPVRTVGDQIAEAIRRHQPQVAGQALQQRVTELLDMVGIAASRRTQYPHQYSGGMRQRAMIAMALACDPQVVIADEPTTALDVMIQAQILELLSTLRQELGLAIIFVTHDLGVVAEICDSVLVMYGGVTAEYADVETIYNAPHHPYTQELLKAFPDLSTPLAQLTSIPGHPPRLDEVLPGCRFAPRCPQVFSRCTQSPPPLYTLANERLGHVHQSSCFLAERGGA